MLYVDIKLLKISVVYNWYKQFKLINHKMRHCQQARNIMEQQKCSLNLHNCDIRSMCDIWTDSKQKWHIIQIGSEHSEGRTVNAASVWQFSLSHLHHRIVSGEETNYTHRPATVLSRSPSMQLLALSKIPDWNQRSQFCIQRRNLAEYNISSHIHTKKGCPEVFPAMAGMLEEVCMCRLAVTDGDIPF